MRFFSIFTSVLCGIALFGCGFSDDASHGHVHDDPPILVYTDYTQSTELFLEFPALQVGQNSRFLAHLTYLDDFTPVKDGEIDVELRKNDKLEARFRVSGATREGLFTPVVSPRTAGQFQLVVNIRNERVNTRHELGLVEVFSADVHPIVEQKETVGDITYLKEQQWRQTFATAVIAEKNLRLSVPGFATVKAPGNQQAKIRAPQAGYFFPEPTLAAGQEVARGQQLGILVPRAESNRDLISLELELADYKTQLLLIDQEVSRFARLVASGAIPQSRMQHAEAEQSRIASRIAATEARIEQREVGSESSGIAIISPLDGFILINHAVSGMYVDVEQEIYEIASQNSRWLEIKIPERFSGFVSNINGAWLELQDRTLQLSPDNSDVVSRTMRINEETRTFSVTLGFVTEIWNPMVGGTFAVNAILESQKSGIAIPLSAVIRQEGTNVVFIHSGGETFERREVALGIRDGDWVEVTSGVGIGERVVIEGAYNVRLAALGGEEIGHGHAH